MAHAILIITKIEPHELLCPFAIVNGMEGRELIEFEADDQESAVTSGKRYLAEPEVGVDAVAFARDGRSLTTALQYVDVVSVSVRDVAGDAECTFSQPYQFQEGRLELLGSIEFLLGDEADNASLGELCRPIVERGMSSHPTAGELIASLRATCRSAPQFLEHTGRLQ